MIRKSVQSLAQSLVCIGTFLLLSAATPVDASEAAAQAMRAGDYHSAISILQKLPENDPVVEEMLGEAYLQINLYPEAAKQFKHAADAGSPWAMYRLGQLLTKGDGVDKDLVKAEQLLSDSAGTTGDVRPIFALALLYDEQKRTDDALAAYYEAANRGFPPAMINLALALVANDDSSGRFGSTTLWLQRSLPVMSPEQRQRFAYDLIRLDQQQAHLPLLDELLSAGVQLDGMSADSPLGPYHTFVPLIIATQVGHDRYVERLLELGANPDGPSDAGKSPLQAAMENYDGSEAFFNTVSLLLQVDGSLDDAGFGYLSTTPLHDIVSLRDPRLIELIAREGLLGGVNGAGESLLMAILQDFKDQPELIELLLEAGHNPNVVTKNGDLAIDYTDNPEIQTALIRYGKTAACRNLPKNAFCSLDWTRRDVLSIDAGDDSMPRLEPQIMADHITQVTSGGGLVAMAAPGQIQLWENQTFHKIRKIDAPIGVTEVRFVAGAQRLIGYGEFGQIVWDTRTAEVLHAPSDQPGLTPEKLSENGRFRADARWREIEVTDLLENDEYGIDINSDETMAEVAVSNDGRTVVAAPLMGNLLRVFVDARNVWTGTAGDEEGSVLDIQLAEDASAILLERSDGLFFLFARLKTSFVDSRHLTSTKSLSPRTVGGFWCRRATPCPAMTRTQVNYLRCGPFTVKRLSHQRALHSSVNVSNMERRD